MPPIGESPPDILLESSTRGATSNPDDLDLDCLNLDEQVDFSEDPVIEDCPTEEEEARLLYGDLDASPSETLTVEPTVETQATPPTVTVEEETPQQQTAPDQPQVVSRQPFVKLRRGRIITVPATTNVSQTLQAKGTSSTATRKEVEGPKQQAEAQKAAKQAYKIPRRPRTEPVVDYNPAGFNNSLAKSTTSSAGTSSTRPEKKKPGKAQRVNPYAATNQKKKRSDQTQAVNREVIKTPPQTNTKRARSKSTAETPKRRKSVSFADTPPASTHRARSVKRREPATQEAPVNRPSIIEIARASQITRTIVQPEVVPSQAFVQPEASSVPTTAVSADETTAAAAAWKKVQTRKRNARKKRATFFKKAAYLRAEEDHELLKNAVPGPNFSKAFARRQEEKLRVILDAHKTKDGYLTLRMPEGYPSQPGRSSLTPFVPPRPSGHPIPIGIPAARGIAGSPITARSSRASPGARARPYLEHKALKAAEIKRIIEEKKQKKLQKAALARRLPPPLSQDEQTNTIRHRTHPRNPYVRKTQPSSTITRSEQQ